MIDSNCFSLQVLSHFDVLNVTKNPVTRGEARPGFYMEPARAKTLAGIEFLNRSAAGFCTPAAAGIFRFVFKHRDQRSRLYENRVATRY
jgi:hypothetical protein